MTRFRVIRRDIVETAIEIEAPEDAAPEEIIAVARAMKDERIFEKIRIVEFEVSRR